MGKRNFLDGVESQGSAPNPFLDQLAMLLRQPPPEPVPNVRTFKRLLALNDIKFKRTQTSFPGVHIAHWIKTNIRSTVIDHYMILTLETGDVLLLTQPYDHPNKKELRRIEAVGGYVVHPDKGWGFLHTCLPDVYLIPRAQLQNFN